MHKLKFRVLPARLAVCRLAADAGVPAFAMSSRFFSITRTRDEQSLVVAEEILSDEAPDPSFRSATIERGWIALQLQGPFPFTLTGVLSSFLDPLAAAQIPIFAISTFDTDYVLIKQVDLNRALSALAAAGHEQIAP